MKLIFATHNESKLKEMKKIMDDSGFEVVGLKEVGIKEDIKEDGKTLTENSLKKARYVSEKTGEWVCADDSGLFIKALNDEPGIHTARWGGKGVKGEALTKFTLDKMKDIPKGERQAYFMCSASVISPQNKEWVFTGRVDGEISTEIQGEIDKSLPYDMIFKPEGRDRTFAEMSEEEKNDKSHRGKAFEKVKMFFKMNMTEISS